MIAERVYTTAEGASRQPSYLGAMNGEPTGRVRLRLRGDLLSPRYITCHDPQEFLDALPGIAIYGNMRETDDGSVVNLHFLIVADIVPLEDAA